MPTTFVSLVIFVLLLAPGFTYTLVAERGRVSGRESTVLRETSAIALSSIVFDLVAGLILLVVAWLLPAPQFNADRLVKNGTPYAKDHYVSISVWSVALVALACLLAVVTAGLVN